MKTGAIILASLIFILFVGIFPHQNALGEISPYDDPTPETLEKLAHCLTEKGWVMYSSFTCSACRAQRKAFRKAFKFIKVIECNPNAPNNQVELCLKRKIKKTPTWLLEKNGQEIKRLTGYQLLENLAPSAECGL